MDCFTFSMRRQMETGSSILLAEDDRTSAEATRELLEARGWEVEWASDGRKAWTLFQRRRPDVVLLDLQMPKMDGIGVIRQIRETDARTPIVLYSGTVGETEEVEALEAGANYVVKKTESPALLVAKVEAVYRHCRAEGREPHVYRLTERVAYNSANRTLNADGERTELTEREGRLVGLLCAHLGGMVAQEELIAGIWGKATLGKKHALEKLVCGVRKKLKETGNVQVVYAENGYALRQA